MRLNNLLSTNMRYSDTSHAHVRLQMFEWELSKIFSSVFSWDWELIWART